MADKITRTNTLGIGLETALSDGKVRTVYLKMPNPKPNLTKQEIIEALAPIVTEQVLVDTEEGPIREVTTAYTEWQEINDIDIGIEH